MTTPIYNNKMYIEKLRYIRDCKRCKEIYWTNAQKSKYCEKCTKPRNKIKNNSSHSLHKTEQNK